MRKNPSKGQPHLGNFLALAIREKSELSWALSYNC